MSAGGATRVTMLARNNFTHDSRIEKEARTLVAAGYRVTVVAEARGDLLLAEARDGYAVRRVERPRTRIRGLRMLAYLRRLEEALTESQPQILHAHDTDALQPVARAAKRLRAPFVYDAHELWLGQENRGRSVLYFALYRAYYGWIERRYLRRAEAHLAANEQIARDLERRYRLPQVRTLHNYPELDVPLARLEIRRLPGGGSIPAEAPIVLHLGAVFAGRGIEELIEAMCLVPAAHLVLLGFGDHDLVERAARALGVRERVHFIPAVAPSEVVSYAASASLGVAPIQPTSSNNSYSLPNKLFEYMAAGLPVLAAQLPQMREVVEGSGAGRTVDSRNPAAMGAAIRELLADPERLREMGARARGAVEERHNWASSAATLRAVYASLSVAESSLSIAE
jgi:glycosyltransferase involved in cell wall biosynthesis